MEKILEKIEAAIDKFIKDASLLGIHAVNKHKEEIAKKDAEIAALQEKVKYLQNDNADRYTRIKELEEELKVIISNSGYYINYESAVEIARAALKGEK